MLTERDSRRPRTGTPRRMGLVTAAVGLAVGLATAPVPASATPNSAFWAQPGPAILHAPPPRAPQLENVPGSDWHAAPILVSGASAYRTGEFLYQDYLFDDRGAGSTYTYPTDPRYAGDAADLVEFRLRTERSGLLIRLTYNAMIDPKLVASTIALGNSAAPRPLPFDAGAREPAQAFVTVHGSTVAVTNAATGQPVFAPGAWARVDPTRRQVTISVPRNVFDTRGMSSLRVASAAGLWDAANNRYLPPVSGAATPTQPGNGGTVGGALFNVAFRFNEPIASVQGFEIWRNVLQSAALKTGDLSAFHADVDLHKLRAGVNDDLPEGRSRRCGIATSPARTASTACPTTPANCSPIRCTCRTSPHPRRATA